MALPDWFILLVAEVQDEGASGSTVISVGLTRIAFKYLDNRPHLLASMNNESRIEVANVLLRDCIHHSINEKDASIEQGK